MAQHYQNKTYIPFVWMDDSNGSIPSNAVVGGTEHYGEKIYVGRAVFKGDTIVGKVVPSQKCIYVPYYNKEHAFSEYQVLTNSFNTTLNWIPAHDGAVPTGAIVGGLEKDGTSLYIGRTMHSNGSMAVGKVHPRLNVLYYPYLHVEYAVKSYEVLVASYLISATVNYEC